MNTPCSLLIYDEVLIGIFATNSLNVSYTFVKIFTYIYFFVRAGIMHINAYMHYAGTTNKKLCL